MAARKRPRVYNSTTNHEVSKTIYETVKVSHEYEIKGYSLTKGTGVGKPITSGRFTVGDGFNQASEEYISVYVRLKSPGEVRAWIELKLLDQSGNGKYSRLTTSRQHKFKRGGRSMYVCVSVLMFFNYVESN
ncbi:hypothetical protein MKX03_009820 [Papaver bracteatum]|nr:hypothetical protein MKX03_009820 [Papaver bracteatum]